jgi:DNA-binding CsgD family transcriptional regulator
MKRPIFVRPLSDAERETLEAGLRSPDAFTLRRCQILLASDRGENAYQIARSLGCNPQTVRNAIYAFNEKGLPRALWQGSKRPHTVHRGPSRVPNRPRLCGSFCITNPGSSAKTPVCGRWIWPLR